MANVSQTQKMVPFITCEVSLGQYVCEFVLGVSVFLGSKLIRSSDQSRATLSVLETCLIVGLLPFIIICVKLRFASCTSNLLEQMYDFQKKRTMFHPKWIFSPPDLLQNRSFETVPICIVWQYCPHNSTVSIHLCDGCKRSNDMIVCHRLWSIL